MAAFNHFISSILAPFPIGLLALMVGLAGLRWKKDERFRKFFKGLVVFACVWLWFFSTGLAVMMLGRPLEKAYMPCDVSEIPVADAIVVLGGGMGINTNLVTRGEIWGSADRVWKGAELYKAGKAPLVFASGGCVEQSTGGLLSDLGVPRESVVFLDDPRNTEEEGRFIAEKMREMGSGTEERKPRVLLVTSAWHLRRAELMFKKAMGDAVEIIPVGCDYETLTRFDSSGWPRLADLWPSGDNLAMTSFLFKEHYAYWAYKILRGF